MAAGRLASLRRALRAEGPVLSDFLQQAPATGQGPRARAAVPSAAQLDALKAALADSPGPLTDTFGRRHRYLRVSLTERCNLRCVYCMPPEGVQLQPAEDMLTPDELARVVRVFAGQGVSKIRLTGGEPTVRKDIEEVVRGMAATEGIESVAMTTNGIALRRKLPALAAAGLRTVNVSLDTLHADKFERITRRRGHDRVLAAIEAALAEGVTTKVNVVVQRGMNEDEVADFVAWTRESPVDVRFIEAMPFLGNEWDEGSFVSYAEMLEHIRERFPGLRRLTEEEGPNDTAKRWAVPGHAGRVGFITSMTEHFCGSCDRLRLTADGSLKVCLFGADEVSLRDAMRAGYSDEQLAVLADAAVRGKHFKLGGHKDMIDIQQAAANRPMILIGG